EHNSILRPLHVLEERGVDLDILDCPIDDLADKILRAIKPNTRMVAISHVDNLVGRVKDIKKIGNSLSRDILFLVDAAQSIGHMPIDVEEARIDLLAAPGHKALMGPMGTGFLYVRDETAVLPFMVGGTGSRSQSLVHPDFAPDKYEAGTENLHGIVGLGAGIDWINETGIEKIEAHVKDLAKTFYRLVKDMPGVIVYGIESDDQITSIVSLNIKDRDSAEVAMALDREGEVAVRSQMHCAPLSHKHFHTLDQGMVRLSFGYFNTMDEVHEAAKILEKIIQDN
ncbi:MAG: aminotransferase class V-fold PLP-dependent enzyme, partial [Ezakiella massiliensis]